MFDDLAGAELVEHGIRMIGARMPLHARRHRSNSLIVLAMSGDSGELAVDTATAHPDLAVFAVTQAAAQWSRRNDEPWIRLEHGLLIAPTGVARRLRYVGPWQAYVVLLPREVVASFVPALPAHAQFVSDRRTLDIAFESFLRAIATTTKPASAIEDYAIGQLLMEMCGAVLLDRTGAVAGRGSPHDVLRDRALAVIAQQCADPDLTPELVARQVQSSLRQLQLIFAAANNSVAVEIRRRRARLARTLLLDSRYDVLSVEQIALRAGFRSPMSLRRALDDFYGVTPRELRSSRHAHPAL